MENRKTDNIYIFTAFSINSDHVLNFIYENEMNSYNDVEFIFDGNSRAYIYIVH